MRRLFNFLGVIALGGLVFALAPSSQALAKPAAKAANTTSSSCGSNGKTPSGTTCNCPPHYAFIAFGNGEAVDDINFVGCYDPTSTDPLIPNDEPELTCPTPGTGSAVNLACGCILAGSGNPGTPAGTDVLINGDTDLGNWKITKLEANFAFGDNDSPTFWIGNPNGSGAGLNGGRCYGAAGFATMQSTSGSAVPVPVLYLELQGTICDTIPLEPGQPQKFSFTGSYIVDGTRSSAYYSGWTGSGTFVISMNDVSEVPSAYSPTYFSFAGYLLP
jgi:hypothetical protein